MRGMVNPMLGTAAAGGGGGGTRQMLRPEVVLARKLRREMSYPEVLLWQRLRGGKIGAKFRKGHPIGPYVVDFYCAALRLVIEVDGFAHEVGDRPKRDANRTIFLEENGYRVVRIEAKDILHDADEVAASIASLVASPLHHPAAPDGPQHRVDRAPHDLGLPGAIQPCVRAGEDM
jgi:very-short-patch-repair endonuclease